MNSKLCISAMAAMLAAVLSGASSAQSIFTEDFPGATTNNKWYFFNGACLTAGSNSSTASPGYVPSCAAIANSYYAQQTDNDPALVGGYTGTLPDPVTHGALRFTNGYPYGHGENGAIVSASSFNAGQGIQITFKAVTYLGDSGGAGKDGADGMSFYLINGAVTPGSITWDGIGSWGGSLGYTCSNANPPYDGLIGAYVGLGIDEFGNFLNGENLMPGYTGPNNATGDNTALGYGYKPNRIGSRGAGNVSWAYLNATYPSYYPSSILNTTALQQAAVQNTCITGAVWNYSGGASRPTMVTNPSPQLRDYPPIPNAYTELSGISIANEFATGGLTRGQATPITYKLKITSDGLLSLSYSINSGAYQSVIAGQSITASNGALPANFLFGFGGSTGGDTNIHEILCFRAPPANQSASSAGLNEQQTAKEAPGAQVYFPYYNPDPWAGSLTS